MASCESTFFDNRGDQLALWCAYPTQASTKTSPDFTFCDSLAQYPTSLTVIPNDNLSLDNFLKGFSDPVSSRLFAPFGKQYLSPTPNTTSASMSRSDQGSQLSPLHLPPFSRQQTGTKLDHDNSTPGRQNVFELGYTYNPDIGVIQRNREYSSFPRSSYHHPYAGGSDQYSSSASQNGTQEYRSVLRTPSSPSSSYHGESEVYPQTPDPTTVNFGPSQGELKQL